MVTSPHAKICVLHGFGDIPFCSGAEPIILRIYTCSTGGRTSSSSSSSSCRVFLKYVHVRMISCDSINGALRSAERGLWAWSSRGDNERQSFLCMVSKQPHTASRCPREWLSTQSYGFGMVLLYIVFRKFRRWPMEVGAGVYAWQGQGLFGYVVYDDIMIS